MAQGNADAGQHRERAGHELLGGREPRRPRVFGEEDRRGAHAEGGVAAAPDPAHHGSVACGHCAATLGARREERRIALRCRIAGRRMVLATDARRPAPEHGAPVRVIRSDGRSDVRHQTSPCWHARVAVLAPAAAPAIGAAAPAPVPLPERLVAGPMSGVAPSGGVSTFTTPAALVAALDSDRPASDRAALARPALPRGRARAFRGRHEGRSAMSLAVRTQTAAGARALFARDRRQILGDAGSAGQETASVHSLRRIPVSLGFAERFTDHGTPLTFVGVVFADGPFYYLVTLGGPRARVRGGTSSTPPRPCSRGSTGIRPSEHGSGPAVAACAVAVVRSPRRIGIQGELGQPSEPSFREVRRGAAHELRHPDARRLRKRRIVGPVGGGRGRLRPWGCVTNDSRRRHRPLRRRTRRRAARPAAIPSPRPTCPRVR